ncbi:glycosyl hydrolase [bacterium]|nr:MAG: glycosyl hydrolase [bacterium]
MKKMHFAVWIGMLMFSFHLPAQQPQKDTTDYFQSKTFSGLKLRLIGPGITSGRIIDLAVNPKDHSNFFVAAASGGVWKTMNGGITFSPVFDSQTSYSIGCVTLDPNNANVVWVGSGENNSQRSVSYGDGVYKSLDGGKNWKNMGLKKSEHIGKIVIDPRNSNVVYVAAQGPLWGPGGDRGLYKSTNGGETWDLSLKISENTGVSDIALDPRDPDVLYVSAYQRRRHVWTLINGGPESAIYKSTDGGKTWAKLSEGLPSGDVGRIGLAISPVNPDVVFALIETSDNSGGFFRSSDRGASWEKRYEYISTSAQYYQEIICDPKDVDRVYSMDTYLKLTDDGGKTWRNLGNEHRHVDDHAIWIDPDNTDHLLIGGDGGLYESYDLGKTFRFSPNLPITQFYRITVDNSEPFYYVYGGTQDNSTWGSPTRTTNNGGITNEDWFLVVGGDGYKAQVDPKDPNIVYGEWQYGGLVRMDRKSGEVLFIQPQPEKGEEHRWNWDTPLLISPHSNTRLYFAANRVFRSDDRGQSWKAVSPDLTRQIDRNKLSVMGKVWGPDAVAKNASTSLFGNIVSLTESPLKENLIFIGTDDGLIQVTEDVQTWRKLDKFPGVPEMTYVSDLFASQHYENVVYASFDNHKNADFKPYLLKSMDKGKSWTSIRGNLPDNGVVYTITEDFVNPNLLFCGTEFGLYFTVDGGKKWIQLKGEFPTIAVRDLEIQKRENDLAIGTFGRGIYILDDYTPLRKLSEDLVKTDAYVFPVKDALMYMPDYSREKYDYGETFYRAKNPDFGAVFTYYLKEEIKSKKQKRKDAEKEAEKKKNVLPYPSFTDLREEDEEQAPYLIFTVTDESGNTIRRLTAPAKAGMNRIAWDLRYPNAAPVTEKTETNKFYGMPVLPGKYKVTMSKNENGMITELFGPVEFTARPLNNTTLPAKDRAALVTFQRKVARLQQAVLAVNAAADEVTKRLILIEKSALTAVGANKSLIEKVRQLKIQIAAIQRTMAGDKTLAKRNENQIPPVTERLQYIIDGTWETTSDPTQTQLDAYSIAAEQFGPALAQLKTVIETDLKSIEDQLEKLNAPWTPGRLPEWKME